MLVHSQPSTPSSRGTTLVAVRRRRIGKRPSLGSARAGPDSAAATAIAPSGMIERLAQHPAVVQLHAGGADLEEVDAATALPALAAGLELEQVLVPGRDRGLGFGGGGLRRRCAGRVGHRGTYIGIEAASVEPRQGGDASAAAITLLRALCVRS